MIISRTPFRVSFFGGGTDFPIWYKNNSSKVINVAINKYCYLNVRRLPPFFKYKFRLRYHQTEEVKLINKIKHPTVRESLKFLKYNDQFEMIHNADLPAQSGLGASSSFSVGLLNCLHALNNRYVSKKNLANQAIFIEQNLVRDFVGSQDQVAASFGGFNIIDFYGNNYKVSQIPLSYRNVKKLVLHQAKIANKAKLDALVCSAQEVKLVKKVFKKEIITPGIRFDSKSNDQKRVVTPKQAFKNGSDWLVIGRPITKGNIKKNIQNLIDHLNK